MSAAEHRARLRQALQRRGETVTVTRGASSATTLARIMGDKTEGIVGDQTLAVRSCIMLAEDLEAASWPVPPRRGDQITLTDGGLATIEECDDRTRRVAGVQVGYDLKVSGL